MKTTTEMPMHVKYFVPILAALRELGGSGSRTEVKDKLIEMLAIPDNVLEEKLKNGIPKIDNQIGWSKMYLVKTGLVDASDNKLWSLTEKGLKAEFTDEDVISIFRKIHGELVSKGSQSRQTEDSTDEEAPAEQPAHRDELLSIIKALPPDGFERLCRRLLRESGFTKVEVTGRTGDGGIDGEGILQINALVSLKVVFQSKRYKDTVVPSVVRDFRGAMAGRAEKGIIITTGRFTPEAKREAIRSGAPPIELVDGEKMIELFEERKLGLKTKTIFEIDEEFFDEFR